MSQGLVVGELVRIRIFNYFSLQAQLSLNILHYVVGATSPTPPTDQDVADQVDGFYSAVYRPAMPATASYRGVEVQILNTVWPYKALYVGATQNAAAGDGTASGAPLPGQVSGLISYQTARPGQGFRGRSYIGFPAIVHDTGAGNPTPAYRVLLNAIGNITAAGIAVVTLGGNTATLVRVILHGKDKTGFIPTPTPVDGFATSANWATQRRRGDFGRQNVSPV